MAYIDMTRKDGVAVLTLNRGKVNAFNDPVVKELRTLLEGLARDDSVGALVLTGHGRFFSFGLDVPELYLLPREEFAAFLRAFTGLYTYIYTYPKAVMAAVNGHAIAGGCMVAIACDMRLMADGGGKIAINEITFGSTVFSGSTEILRACIGHRNAETVMMSGAMFDPAQALAIGLVDRVVPDEDLLPVAIEEAATMASRDPAAFQSMRTLLRGRIAESILSHEDDSIREFVDIWYSPSTREQLKKIVIRD
ncbi:MAG: enoyl-CoA hydratase/isomerase family protein [bacterium]|jgi:enoyl-CoA hydratase/carnithine racemase